MNGDFRNVLFAFGLIIAVIVAGTVMFWMLEPWSLLDSLYFTVYTITTVGYGNVVPSPENRLFVTMFILVCATVTLACIAIIGNWLIAVVQKRSAQKDMRDDNERLKDKLGFHGHDVEGHLDTIHQDLQDSIRRI